MKKILCATLVALGVGPFANAQSVSINTDGSPANSSAMLEVKSNNKGLLIPRLSLTERGGIGSPATGLLIYQTDNTPGFYFYNGATWNLLGSNPDASALTTGTLPDARLSPNVTTQGNTFNAANRLVQLNATAQLPAVSGANLTNLNASNLATGTVPTARLGTGTASAGTFLRGDGTWAAAGGSANLFAQKSADEVENTTTLQDDDHLFINLEANRTYLIMGTLLATRQNAGTSDGYRFNLSYSGTMGLVGQGLGTNFSNVFPPPDAVSTLVGVLGVFNQFAIQGVYTTTSAGTLRVRWAKNGTTNNNPTIIGRGSYLCAIPLS
jgi:hypothetical protein